MLSPHALPPRGWTEIKGLYGKYKINFVKVNIDYAIDNTTTSN